MHIVGELIKNKVKQQRLWEERNIEFQVLEDAKNIVADALSTKVDTSQPILALLVEVV